MPQLAIRWALIVVLVLCLGLFAANLFLLLKFPLYVDETQWKIINSRVFLDNFSLRYLFPACPTGYVVGVPITWIPSRFLDAVLYADPSQPILVRLLGIVSGSFILGAIGFVAKPTNFAPRSASVAFTIATASSFGVLLPLLVMNRPEQGILVPFAVAAALYVGLKVSDERRSGVASALVTVAFTILTWMMLGAHIKSFILLPAIFLMAASTIRRPLLLAVYVALAAWCFLETYSVWSSRIDCPQLPHLQSVFTNLSLSPQLLLTSPKAFAARAIGNLADVGLYLRNAELALNYQSFWFPSSTKINALDQVSNVLLYAAFFGFICIVALGLLFAVGRGGGVFESLRRPSSIAAAILLGLVCLAAYQTTKNFYEAALIWPLVLLAAALASRDVRLGSFGWATRWLVLAVALSAVVAQSALLLQLQARTHIWQQELEAEAHALVEVDQVARQCGAENTVSEKGLLVDEIAFQRFWKADRPILFDFFSGWWATGLNQSAAIVSWPIDRIIAQCERIPTEVEALAAARSSSGKYCCLTFSPSS